MGVPDSEIRVLHVDDEPAVAEVAADHLRRENDEFAVVVETDASDGLQRLADERFDAVVSDFDMPGMDGLEFLTAVREQYPDLPFVLFTGKGTEEIASEAISAGVTDYLQKGTGPEKYAVLANRLENAVSRYRAERRAERHRRVNRLVNEVNQALVRASSRAEVERSTCRLIDGADPYEFACIGAVDVDSPRVRSAAVDDALESVLLESMTDADGTAATDLVELALAEGSTVAVNDVTDPGEDPLQRLAVERDCRAVAVVPLEDDGETLGVLAVFSATPDVFDDRERELLAELGADIERAVREVEVRQRLRRTKERFRKTFEASNDAIMLVDMADEEFLEVNPAACEMLGYDESELLELDPEDIHPDDIDRVREEFISQVLEEGTGWTDDMTCLTKDGEQVPTEISGATLELAEDDEPPATMVAVLRDISEREAYRRSLEQQVDRLDEFVSVLSHDLRNPLNVAQGQVELAREAHDLEALEEAKAALDRIDQLVEQSLTLARSGRQAGDTDPVDLGDVAEGCWGNVLTGEATLVVSDPPTVAADADRLQQLFENLFRNAVEHGGEGVTVRVGGTEEGFYVADDGPGIPPGERDAVLEAGFTTHDDGTGLGLAIVRRIAEAHGWTVTVTGGNDGGARFEFTVVE